VLPYIAPEILNGRPYTFASDIYSFGIIMAEVTTGKPPYSNIPHDVSLALAICNGLRPRVARGTPQCYIDLANQCLDANPEKRPSAKAILRTIRNWRHYKESSCLKELISGKLAPIDMFKDFVEADKVISQELSSKKTLHPEAIYTSRLMSFPKLPKSKNSNGVQVEIPECK
jgi:serine/threonine protein kinase